MSWTQAVLQGGLRLLDDLSTGVLAQVYPIGSVREAVASCDRQPDRSLLDDTIPPAAMARPCWSSGMTAGAADDLLPEQVRQCAPCPVRAGRQAANELGHQPVHPRGPNRELQI